MNQEAVAAQVLVLVAEVESLKRLVVGDEPRLLRDQSSLHGRRATVSACAAQPPVVLRRDGDIDEYLTYGYLTD